VPSVEDTVLFTDMMMAVTVALSFRSRLNETSMVG